MHTEPFTPLPVDPFIGRGVRSGGVHVSQIIAMLEEAMGKKPYEAVDTEWGEAAMVGFLWEDAMAAAFRNQYRVSGGKALVRPGEIEHDGILMTPDDVEMLPSGEAVVWDYKATWKSLRTSPPEDIWKWKVQLQAYCYALGCTTAKIIALYMCGDYRPPSPKVVGRQFTWTAQELATTWRMLVGGRDNILKRGG